MSDLDIKALDANFESWKKERAPELSSAKAFERYCFEQILKDADLSDEDLEYGITGGGDDGGIDAIYLFMNSTLITEDTETPDPTTSVELVLIQATRESSFTEEKAEKFHAFARDLLDYSKQVTSMTYYNSHIKNSIIHFRTKYDEVLASSHTLKIKFYYASRSTSAPHPKIISRNNNLISFVKSKLSLADVTVDLWGSSRLLEAARHVPTQRETIPINCHFSTADGSVVCLVGLKDFATFLTDENGRLKTRMLEPNVRDYQGKRNPVNFQIRTTLNSITKEEFWWLNNGITILATECSVTGNKLTVTRPEIVNGLQTSYEIFEAFADTPDKLDTRNVLVRILLIQDESSRNQIIKATNSQTPVDILSLRATDRIHMDIEDRLKIYDLFYDRRKGEQRRLRKPISKIISVRSLAQSCMAILLQEPNSARARPQTVLKNDSQYGHLFKEDNNRDFYVTCILIDLEVYKFLETKDISSEEKRDIRFYMDTIVACELTKKAKPNVSDLASVVKISLGMISMELLESVCALVLQCYRKLGGNDTVAKGTKLKDEIISLMIQKFPPPQVAHPST